MRRRHFCASALATIAATTVSRSLLAAVAEALGPIKADIAAMGGRGQSITLLQRDVEDFRRSLRGLLLTRSDEGYDSARKIWNGAFDRHPALIARCTGAADVIQAVNFARAHELLVAVRGGGHSLSGQSVCEGGLMIDLSPMKGIRVDPVNMRARAEPGVLLGEFDRETQSFGLATTAGTVSHTGIAGLTLGGGFGRLGRKYGLACDNLTSVDIVTADGRFLQANTKQNLDLFWGVRGGGGNFGVVTSFEYQLHKVGPTLFGGKLIYPFEQAREVLKFFAEYSKQTPDELYLEPAVAIEPNGDRAFLVDVCYCGSPAEGERALAPLLGFRKPVQSLIGQAAYVDLQQSTDAEAMAGPGYYTRSGYLRGIEPSLIDEALSLIEESPVRPVILFFSDTGGATARVKPTETAYAQREARHIFILMTVWTEPADGEAKTQWARAKWRGIEPHTMGFYANVTTLDKTAQQIRDNYGVNLERLVALKRKYDPGNLLRMNANIPPAL